MNSSPASMNCIPSAIHWVWRSVGGVLKRDLRPGRAQVFGGISAWQRVRTWPRATAMAAHVKIEARPRFQILPSGRRLVKRSGQRIAVARLNRASLPVRLETASSQQAGAKPRSHLGNHLCRQELELAPSLRRRRIAEAGVQCSTSPTTGSWRSLRRGQATIVLRHESRPR